MLIRCKSIVIIIDITHRKIKVKPIRMMALKRRKKDQTNLSKQPLSSTKLCSQKLNSKIQTLSFSG